MSCIFISLCKTGHLIQYELKMKSSLFKIELKSVYLTWKISILHEVYGSLLKSTLCINMVCIQTNILKVYKYVIYFL